MTTMIGTPPNLIVSGFRAQNGGSNFAMLDFTPVGLAVAASGILFVALIGWRLVPIRKQAASEGFDTEAYLTEARVEKGSKAAGLTLREVEALLDDAGGGAQIIGLVRNEVRLTPPSQSRMVYTGDILVIEAEADALICSVVGETDVGSAAHHAHEITIQMWRRGKVRGGIGHYIRGDFRIYLCRSEVIHGRLHDRVGDFLHQIMGHLEGRLAVLMVTEGRDGKNGGNDYGAEEKDNINLESPVAQAGNARGIRFWTME